jgi:vacuolar-type H+-ATPase subunit H
MTQRQRAARVQKEAERRAQKEATDALQTAREQRARRAAHVLK